MKSVMFHSCSESSQARIAHLQSFVEIAFCQSPSFRCLFTLSCVKWANTTSFDAVFALGRRKGCCRGVQLSHKFCQSQISPPWSLHRTNALIHLSNQCRWLRVLCELDAFTVNTNRRFIRFIFMQIFRNIHHNLHALFIFTIIG